MNKTAKIINISNVSGGVGKSTTAIELATYFGMQGKKVLIVDADMQASATDCIGAKGQPLTIKELQTMDEKIESGTNFINVLDECLIENVASDLCEVLDDPDMIEDVIVPTEHMNVSLLPASIRLCQADKNLSDDRTRSAVDRLVCAFENVQDRYDYILIDNSPAQTLVSTNTLLASDLNIIPVKLDRKSIKGMIVSLKNTITIAKRNKKNVDLKVLFTMVSPRGKTEKNLIPWFRKQMDDMIFQTIIPYQKKPTQDASMMNRQVVLTNTNVGNAYKSLGEEIIALLENMD
jgi:chromosome partitioning protein